MTLSPPMAQMAAACGWASFPIWRARKPQATVYADTLELFIAADALGFDVGAGSPDEVIESLRRAPLLSRTTDLICQIQPGLPSLTQTLDALELIATEVAPAFGWIPATATAESSLTPGPSPIAMGEGS